MPPDNDGTVTDVVDLNNDVSIGNDLQIDDFTTGSDALDKSLDAFAKGTSRETTTPDSTQQVPKGPGTTTQTRQATTSTPQRTANTQPQSPQQQPNPGIGGWAGKAPRAYGQRFNWDAQGNVIDVASKQIIAAAGGERKSFERMLPLINSATTEVDKWKGMYESAAKANTVASGLGLTPEEFSVGARIMSTWKSDPKKALTFLINEAKNNGIDMSDLGVASGGLSVKQIQDTVKQIVEDSLKPFSFITQERQQQEEYNEAINEARGVISEFYDRQPDAVLHEESLAKVMNAVPGTDVEKAYLILRNHAFTNGLDWTKDLVPQVDALMKRQNGNGNGNTPVTEQPAPQRQLPNMTGRSSVPDTTVVLPKTLPGTASTGDIVKEAMRQAGMDISSLN